MFRYTCHCCGEEHEGLPDFGWDYPIDYLMIPEEERAERVELTEDSCVIDDDTFFVRGCVEIPIHGYDEPLVWGLWVSLSERSFGIYCDTFESEEREQEGPFFGWLTAVPPIYPDAMLKTMVHLRPYPLRPYIELEPTDHPFAVDQRQGISSEKAQAIAEQLLHVDGLNELPD